MSIAGRSVLRFAVAIALAGWAAPNVCAQDVLAVTIDADRMLVVGGQRTFVLGLYETSQDDALLADVAVAGFNLVRTPADLEALDKLHSHGLHAWITTGGAIDLSTNRSDSENGLRTMVESFGSHPALLVWEVPDEALWNVWYGPLNWRRTGEQEALRGHIAALEDRDLAKRLTSRMNKGDTRFLRGEFKAWEDATADVWHGLGQEQPRADQKISNAPERAARMAEGMLEGYQFLKELDPNHPVWMNHAPRNSQPQLALFNRAADIVGCDIYPVPPYRGGHSDIRDRSLSAAGAYTTIMQEAAPGKPVWMVLQGFGWADLTENPSEEEVKEKPRPSYNQSRFMAYDAIVRGARGILYWGTYRIEKDSELWNSLLRLARELADLQPMLSAREANLDLEVTLAETWGSVDKGVEVLAKNVDGRTWFLVVNEWHEPLQYTLSGLDALEGTAYTDPDAERNAVVTDGKLDLSIRGLGVQVLRVNP